MRAWLLPLTFLLGTCSASVRPQPSAQPTLPGGPAPEQVPVMSAETGQLRLPGATSRPVADALVPLVVSSRWLDAVVLAPPGVHVRVDKQSAHLSDDAGFDLELRPHAPDLFANQMQVLRAPGTHLRSETRDTQVIERLDAHGRPTYEFLAMIETGGRVFTCRSTPPRTFRHQDVLTMVKACWSLTARSVATDDTVR